MDKLQHRPETSYLGKNLGRKESTNCQVYLGPRNSLQIGHKASWETETPRKARVLFSSGVRGTFPVEKPMQRP